MSHRVKYQWIVLQLYLFTKPTLGLLIFHCIKTIYIKWLIKVLEKVLFPICELGYNTKEPLLAYIPNKAVSWSLIFQLFVESSVSRLYGDICDRGDSFFQCVHKSVRDSIATDV